MFRSEENTSMTEKETVNAEIERRKAQQEEAKLWMSYARDDYDVAHPF